MVPRNPPTHPRLGTTNCREGNIFLKRHLFDDFHASYIKIMFLIRRIMKTQKSI